MTRRRTGPDAGTREAVYQRDHAACCRCGDRDGAFQIHHRRPRGMGGTRRPETNGLAALVLLCETCHRHIESHRDEALSNGWLVRQHQDAAVVPFLYRGAFVVLSDLGAVEPLEASA